MSQPTRVPLQPIAKGSLTKFWIALAAVVLVAAVVAWFVVPRYEMLENGVKMQTLVEGEGTSPGSTDFVLVNYTGTLDDGTVFDQGEGTPMQVDGVVPGFSTALQAMETGGKYKVKIPADQAYGEQGGGPIPPNSDLTFEVELLDFRSQQEVQQMQQQMMQQQQLMEQLQGGGAPLPGQ